MIIKILGLLDILAGLTFWIFGVFGVGSLSGLVLLLGFLLLGKGAIFLISLDIVSLFDVVFGLIMIVGISYDVPVFVFVIVGLFLIQKGVFSLVG